jgi:acyl-CoA synthetase (AMP-forming)/AMP-acid ligase II
MGIEGAGTIVHALASQAKVSPEKTAVICGPESITYGELWSKAIAIANHIENLSPSASDAPLSVGIVISNGLLTAPILFGIMACGATASVFNPDQPPPRLPNDLAAAKPDIVICDATTAHAVNPVAKRESIAVVNISLDHLPPVSQNDERGFPAPGAMALRVADSEKPLRHDQLLKLVEEDEIVDGVETVLSANPIYRIWGVVNGTLGPLAKGATLVTVSGFRANAILKELSTNRIQLLALGSGSQLRVLVGDPLINSLDFSALQVTQCETGTLEKETAQAWCAKTGSQIVEV